MKDFKQECLDWLSPFGYGVQWESGNGKAIGLACYEKLGENYPGITCYNDNDQKTAKISDNGLKLFLSIESGELSFGHSDIARYLEVFKHYMDLCTQNPPF